MEAKDIYEVPYAGKLDGLTLFSETIQLLSKQRIDEYRLQEGDDILVATYPRTGTTWLSQILCLLLAKEEEYDETKRVEYTKRVTYLEHAQPGTHCWGIKSFHTVPAPRVNKTHLPYRFIRRWIDEDNVKTIITTRNPKDTLVSLYHFYRDMKQFEFSGSWTEFFEHVKAGKCIYGDHYAWLEDWNNKKENGQLLFIKYEDLKQETMTQLDTICDFLNISVSARHMENVLRDTSVSQMKVDLAGMIPSEKPGGGFVRKGISGGWKKYFTVEQNEWFDKKYKKLYEELDIDVHYE